MYYTTNELYHHGIKGQKWGVRRYQNPDGTLTEEGKRRYAKSIARGEELIKKDRGAGTELFRGVVKQAGIKLGTDFVRNFITEGVLAGMSLSAIAAAGPTIALGYAAVDAMKMGLTVANVVTTVKNIRGIDNARKFRSQNIQKQIN